MDIDGEELDAILWEEDYGRGVGGGNVDDEDYSASTQFPIRAQNSKLAFGKLNLRVVFIGQKTSPSFQFKSTKVSPRPKAWLTSQARKVSTDMM
jgi:hypothetical protein